ncbi:acyltransferase family protein [Micromonospora coerulea]|uniref:acyltransferase family protein n=1 Tax=Micromonospora coerulea TaxID=47856 RepID=UPI0019043C83|nr:acyltransferase family protein [Micromonospora veneta]
MRRLYEIDLLRIIAALAVVVFHYTFSGWTQGHSPVSFPALGEVSRYGHLNVDLFFVISGFGVLLSAWDRRPGSSSSPESCRERRRGADEERAEGRPTSGPRRPRRRSAGAPPLRTPSGSLGGVGQS